MVIGNGMRGITPRVKTVYLRQSEAYLKPGYVVYTLQLLGWDLLNLFNVFMFCSKFITFW